MDSKPKITVDVEVIELNDTLYQGYLRITKTLQGKVEGRSTARGIPGPWPTEHQARGAAEEFAKKQHF